MALQKFRRHTRKCTKQHRPYERLRDDCLCNYSVEGMLAGKFIRKTAGTPYAQQADALIKRAEKNLYWTDVIAEKKEAEPVANVAVKATNGYTVQKATEDFFDYIKSTTDGEVASGTVMNYNATMRDFAGWCQTNQKIYVKDLTTFDMVRYKDTWGKPNENRKKGLGPTTQKEYVSRLKVFGDYCEERGKCLVNFARKLKHPKAVHVERPPFTDAEMANIEHFAMTVTEKRPASISGYRVLTLIYMMRWAGMSIGDAVLLTKAKIVGDEVHYWREKTKRQLKRVHVIVPLPRWLLERLKALEETEGLFHGKYYFAKGVTMLPGAEVSWRQYLTPIFAAVGIAGCPSHRFRHTFAEKNLIRIAELGVKEDGSIQSGYIPVSVVAGWMGHGDEQTTRKHYNATITSREAIGSGLMRGMHAEDDARRLSQV